MHSMMSRQVGGCGKSGGTVVSTPLDSTPSVVSLLVTPELVVSGSGCDVEVVVVVVVSTADVPVAPVGSSVSVASGSG